MQFWTSTYNPSKFHRTNPPFPTFLLKYSCVHTTRNEILNTLCQYFTLCTHLLHLNSRVETLMTSKATKLLSSTILWSNNSRNFYGCCFGGSYFFSTKLTGVIETEKSNWTLRSSLHVKTCLQLIPVHNRVQAVGSCKHPAAIQKLHYLCMQQFRNKGGNQLQHWNLNSCVSFQPCRLYTWIFLMTHFPLFKYYNVKVLVNLAVLLQNHCL